MDASDPRQLLLCNAGLCSSRIAPQKAAAGVSDGLHVQITPLTAYAIEVQSTTDGGSGLAGATFYTGTGQKLSAQGTRLASSGGGTQGGTLVAPPGSYFIALWVGNWQDGGTLQVCLLCIYVTWHHFDMSIPPLWSVAHRDEMISN